MSELSQLNARLVREQFGAAKSLTKWTPAELDQLMDAARRAGSTAERIAIKREAYERSIENTPTEW